MHFKNSIIIIGDLSFELNGNTYHNGSAVFIDDIGVGNNALLCRTTRSDCCSGVNRLGEFYYPDGTLVGIQSLNQPMYRNRGSQMIRLNRNSNSPSLPSNGWYRCEIPSASGVLQSISINIRGRNMSNFNTLLVIENPFFRQLRDFVHHSVIPLVVQ